MKTLIDTHGLIWMVQDESLLSPLARQTRNLPSTVMLVSTVSLWEIALKSSLGKLRLRFSLPELIDVELPSAGIEILPIKREHLLRLQALPSPQRSRRSLRP